MFRAIRYGDAIWTVWRAPGGPVDMHLVSGMSKPPVVDIFDSENLPQTNELTRGLVAAGPVARLRNCDVWDALATGVIRQVIRAGQARKLYTQLCREYGQRVGHALLLPTPEVLIGLGDSEFASLGLSFKRAALRAAAEAVLKHGDEWLILPADDLMVALRTVYRIGPWTAATTVADLTNDFAVYPHGDLAVRTWARQIAPRMDWPDTEAEFATKWRRLAAGHLSAVTVLTLAQGGRV